MPKGNSTKLVKTEQPYEKYNALVASAIADTIRFSLDDEYRQKCYTLMKVDNTNDCQLAIRTKLDVLTGVTPQPSLMKDASLSRSETVEESRNAHREQDSYKMVYEAELNVKTLLEGNKPHTETGETLETSNDPLLADDFNWHEQPKDQKVALSCPILEGSKKVRYNVQQEQFWPTEDCCTWSTDAKTNEEETLNALDTEWN